MLAYRKAAHVTYSIFELMRSLPKAETYCLTDQVRRSSRSVGAQIAAGYTLDDIQNGITPVYESVDTCAAEFTAFTPYYYSSYEKETGA